MDTIQPKTTVYVEKLVHVLTNLQIAKNIVTLNVSYGKTHVVTNFIKAGGTLKWWVRGNRNFGFGVFWSEEEQVDDFFV